MTIEYGNNEVDIFYRYCKREKRSACWLLNYNLVYSLPRHTVYHLHIFDNFTVPYQ